MPTQLSGLTLDFALPWALLGLLVLPLFWILDRVSRTHLPRRRRRLALLVRMLVAALLVVGMAQPRITGKADRQAVAFLIDVSDSINPSIRERQIAWLRDAMAGMGERDLAAFIAFGDSAVVDRPPSPNKQVLPVTSVIQGTKTDIASAIQLALATLPNTMARKIVILSDGNENVGSAVAQSKVSGAVGVPISVVPLVEQPGPEVLVRQLETPSFLRQGETFGATVTIDATRETRARVHLLIDGRLAASQDAELHAGSNSVLIPQEPLAPGFHVFRVQIEARDDGYIQNNESGSYTYVAGKPRVLLVEGESGETRYLAEALQSAGLDTEVRDTSSVVLDLPTLRGYESVVLANVSANVLNVAQMRAINSYVQNLGGGLVVIGGDRSYGVGRYGKTPLEEALPVRMDLRGRTLSSSVALMLVIDASGSMAGGPGSSKMDLAKEAAVRAVELLSEQDQVGVLSFDDGSRWVVETQFLTDVQSVQGLIGTINPGGGTAIFPALETAYNDLVNREAKVKHMLLLTDGLSSGGDYDRLTSQMMANGITLSTIAVGTDADFTLLRRLAELGKGRYFEGNDPFEVPQMVVKDTQEVARAAIVEEPFRPAQIGVSPILEGIDAERIPPLLGYVSTTPKPNSQVLLISGQGDPVLSEWKYGLGHVVAWTSDAKNRWSTDWLTWPEYSRFWAQVVKRTIPNPVDRNLQVQISTEGEQARVIVDAISDDKALQNFLATKATLVDPVNKQSELALPQVAPGRYEAKVPLANEGAYFLNIVQTGPDGNPQAGRPAGFVISYSPEYRELRANPEVLEKVAKESGGKVLAGPAGIFDIDREVSGQPNELWPWFLAAAALLFLFDVAARRLRMSWMDAQIAWGYVLDRWLGRAQQVAAPAASRLLAAKGRIIVASGGPPDGEGVGTLAGGQAPGSRSASTTALGARLLDAKKRARE
jgi:uncharacterized membrane protein